jgi:ribosomal protein S24E
MKEIKIQLRSHEEKMLIEVQKVNKRFRDPEGVLLNLIQVEYLKTTKGKTETT